MSGVFIIAEIGSSHCGSLGLACQAASAFAAAGANGIKYQDHFDQRTPGDAQHPPWFVGPREILTRAGYLLATGFSDDEWKALADHVKGLGCEYVCSPFSLAAAERQAPLVDRWKIASGQVTNLEMLRFIGATGKPVIVSRGMGSAEELDAADGALYDFVSEPDYWLACSSLYPCPPELAPSLRFGGDGEPDGLSDHTEGIAACLGAVALGATIIEKHATLTRLGFGTDVGPWALEPDEFAQMVREIRALEIMLRGRDEAAYRERVAETRRAFMATSERKAAE